MKFKKLVLIPVSAMLIGCGGGFSTDVNIPSGGETIVVDPEDSESATTRANYVKELLTSALSTPIFTGLGQYTMHLDVDAKFGMVVSRGSYVYEGGSEVYTTWGDFEIKGQINLSVYSGTDYRNALRLEVKDLDFSYAIKQTIETYYEGRYTSYTFEIADFTISGLNVSLDYYYTFYNESYFYLDLSDSSVLKAINDLEKQSIAISSKQSEPEDREEDVARIKETFAQIRTIISYYSKTRYTAADILGLFPESESKAVTTIRSLLDGNLVSNLSAFIGQLISEKGEQLDFYLNMAAAFISSKEQTTVKDYSTDSIKSVGFSTSFKKEEIEMVGGLIAGETVTLDKASLGLAAIASNDNPFNDYRIQSINLRADMALENVFYFKGSLGLSFTYGDFLPLTTGQMVEYKDGAGLIEQIKELVGSNDGAVQDSSEPVSPEEI